MNDTHTKSNPENLLNTLKEMIKTIDHHVQEKTAAHQVEQQIFKGILGLGYHLLNHYFQQFGHYNQGKVVNLKEGQKVTRFPQLRQKKYHSIFGEIILKRWVYGSRVGQKITYIPLDACLQLPQKKPSYLLQQWQQRLAGQMTYEQTQKTLNMILGQTPSTHTLQRETKTLGLSLAAYQEKKPLSSPASATEIVVSTIDGKGVPIRKGDKKMALVSCSYTIASHLRRPEEVLNALFSQDERPHNQGSRKRPKPQEKQVYTSLLRDKNESMKPSMKASYDWLEQEYQQRNPHHQHPHIALIDGQVSLAHEMQKRFESHGNYVEILDILHVAGYAWDAAKTFYTEEKLQRFYAHYCIKNILQGKVDQVITSLKLLKEKQGLKGKKVKKIHTVEVYFSNNRYRMKYNEYLSKGYPIASGVIEGACRSVVKDRMERSGMRWSIEGAESLLKLRCIDINGEWQTYMNFHIQQENQRLYPKAANDEKIQSLLLIA